MSVFIWLAEAGDPYTDSLSVQPVFLVVKSCSIHNGSKELGDVKNLLEPQALPAHKWLFIITFHFISSVFKDFFFFDVVLLLSAHRQTFGHRNCSFCPSSTKISSTDFLRFTFYKELVF